LSLTSEQSYNTTTLNENEKELVTMTTIALFGGAGRMGTHIANVLKDEPEYRMLYVEAGAGLARLRERGLTATPREAAIHEADVVILAIPDVLIGTVAADVVPSLKSGAMVICLDPAAPHGGELPERADIAYFITHPCHPSLVNDEVDPEARKDRWGGKAKQNIVCALMQGDESDYAKGEKIARKMFAPVMNAHRITVEQMAILEPALAETVAYTCMVAIREALDEAIRRGVPVQVAWDFLMGHMNAIVGIVFVYGDSRVSEGAKLAVERAKKKIFRLDWKKIFEPENVMNEVKEIAQARSAAK
jgi:hypothetical protein